LKIFINILFALLIGCGVNTPVFAEGEVWPDNAYLEHRLFDMEKRIVDIESLSAGQDHKVLTSATDDSASYLDDLVDGTTLVVSADTLVVNSITADNIDVDNLSAISANLGTITAGTITGATIQTATGNPKVVMDGDGLTAADGDGNFIFEVETTGTDVGDITIGDYEGTGGARWDDSENLFTINGVLNATTGTIGGFTIGSTSLSAGSGGTGVGLAPGTYPFYAGSETPGTAPFRVSNAGAITASSGTIGGSVLGDTYIRSSDFVSGALGAGWQLGANLAEFNNIRARGKITTAVFARDVISSIGGNFLVSDSDILDADMTAADASTMTILGDTTFVANDILRIKDGTDDEWFTVTNAGSAPVYTVTRDRAGDYTANANPIWKKGTAVVSYGASGEGLIFMTASEANAPHIDVLTHAGSPWTTTTTEMRMGNLNGFLGYSTDKYGIAIGETDNYLKYDATNGLSIKGVVSLESGSTGASEATGWAATEDSTLIDGGNIYTGTITAQSIAVDSITGDHIKANTIEASSIISIPFGKITAGTLESVEIILGDGGVFKSANYVESTTGFMLNDTDGLEINSGAVNADVVLIEGARLRDQFEVTAHSIIEDEDSGEWDQGTDSGTKSSSDVLELSDINTAGNFTSQILDAGTSPEFGTIQWTETYTNVENEVGTDGTPTKYIGTGSATSATNINDSNDSTSVNWGDGTNYWGNHAIGEIDLGSAKSITGWRVVCGSSGTIPVKGWKLQYSDNGSPSGTWTDLTSQYYTTTASDTISASSHRYWRWYGGVNAEYYDNWFLSSLELFTTEAVDPDVTLQVRTDDDSDMSSPTAYSSALTNPFGSNIDIDDNRYIQYKATWTTTATAKDYVTIDDIKINFDDVESTSLALAKDYTDAYHPDLSAGDILHNQSDGLTSLVGTSYVKVKEFTIIKDGTYRIKFSLTGADGYGRIYRNGVAVGTERNVSTSPAYTEYSEDISGWSEGDLCQLYVHDTAGNGCISKNFRIYSDISELRYGVSKFNTAIEGSTSPLTASQLTAVLEGLGFL